MKSFWLSALIAGLFMAACSKQTDVPVTTTTPVITPVPAPKSSISVFINNNPMRVDSIYYNHSYNPGSQYGGFNFTAQNGLQKVSGSCFLFWQKSRWDYQYCDSVTYSYRSDSLGAWNTITADKWGQVDFDGISAPLTDSIVGGTFSGQFNQGKSPLAITGTFYLVF